MKHITVNYNKFESVSGVVEDKHVTQIVLSLYQPSVHNEPWLIMRSTLLKTFTLARSGRISLSTGSC